MAHLRFQVSTFGASDIPKDYIENVFYLNAATLFDGAFLPDLPISTDEQALCDDACAVWANYKPYPADITRCQVKVYNMADAKPRPVRAFKELAINSHSSENSGPREVALCMSFYSGRNLPRSRGRLYLGPWPSNQLALRPTDTVRQYALTLAQAIADLGAANVDWNIHSIADNDFKKVSNVWVDNEWDTMRSRGIRGTDRMTLTVDEQVAVIDGHPVAPWIADRLRWARRHGWHGKVISGVRSRAEQQRLWDDFQAGRRNGPVARPGTSNHEGRVFPRGAVDVTQPLELAAVLERWPGSGHPLIPFGPGDLPHFSATGR